MLKSEILTVYIEGSRKKPSDSCKEGNRKMTTCSSSVLELSSGMVSGNAVSIAGNVVSFGEDTQLPCNTLFDSVFLRLCENNDVHLHHWV